MRQGLSMSLLALVVTFGGVVGVQLGRDAVGEIRPVFFSDLPDQPTPYVDYAAAPMQLGATAVPASTRWGYPYYLAGRPVCWGCPEKPERYADAYYDSSDGLIPTSGHAVARRAPQDPAAQIGDNPVQPRAIDRYASFPVTQEEARRLNHVVELQNGRRSAFESDAGQGQPVGM